MVIISPTKEPLLSTITTVSLNVTLVVSLAEPLLLVSMAMVSVAMHGNRVHGNSYGILVDSSGTGA